MDRLTAAAGSLAGIVEGWEVSGLLSSEEFQATDRNLNRTVAEAWAEATREQMLKFLDGLERKGVLPWDDFCSLEESVCQWED